MSIKVDRNLLRATSYILHYSAQRDWKWYGRYETKQNIGKKRRAKKITFVLEKIITLSLIKIQSTIKIM